MYSTEYAKMCLSQPKSGLDELSVAETFGRDLLGAETDHLSKITRRDRERIFNLVYST